MDKMRLLEASGSTTIAPLNSEHETFNDVKLIEQYALWINWIAPENHGQDMAYFIVGEFKYILIFKVCLFHQVHIFKVLLRICFFLSCENNI